MGRGTEDRTDSVSLEVIADISFDSRRNEIQLPGWPAVLQVQFVEPWDDDEMVGHLTKLVCD